jgi:hypothetical protein
VDHDLDQGGSLGCNPGQGLDMHEDLRESLVRGSCSQAGSSGTMLASFSCHWRGITYFIGIAGLGESRQPGGLVPIGVEIPATLVIAVEVVFEFVGLILVGRVARVPRAKLASMDPRS